MNFPLTIINNMKKILALLICSLSAQFILAQIPSAAQTNINRMVPNPVLKSPNAASLGKYGDYQVSYYNGLPDISIPIFDAESGSLHAPITLSYHASGFRPTDIASWVGLGWSLSAGGQVSRTVQGKVDESPAGYYGTPLIPNAITCGAGGTPAFSYLKDLVNVQKDGEPDIFSYQFAGRSGKFILPNGQSPYLIPAAPILINPYGIQKFEITDESGVFYRFGPNLSSQESSNSDNGSSIGGTSAWLMTDMIAPNADDQITFSYQNIGNATTNDVMYSWVLMDQCYLQNSPQTSATCPPVAGIRQTAAFSSTVVQRGLQTIAFENGKVEFVLAGNSRSDMSTLKALDHIDIYNMVDNVYVLIKSVKFNYSYFTNAANGNAALKLDNIQVKDKDGNNIQQYKFSYFTTTFSWNPAADYLNYRDWWGYYNGATQNTDLFPKQTIATQSINNVTTNVDIGGALDRSVNPQFIKDGVLKRIDFPTGGYTEFDFESNKYLNGATPTLAGGLRVTKIISVDNNGSSPIVKTFKYGENESGYGYPKFSTNEFNYIATQYYYSDCLIFGGAITNFRVRSYHSNSAFRIEDSSVGYPVVTEYNGDYAGVTLGKTVYEYDNKQAILDDDDQVVPNSGRYFKPIVGWTRGLLTKKTVFDNSNNQTSESTTIYSLFQQTNSKLIGVGASQYITGNYVDCPAYPPLNSTLCTNDIGESVSSLTFFSRNFTQSSGIYLPTIFTEKIYQRGTTNYLTVQTTRTYDDARLQPLQVKTSRSDKDESVTITRYPFQLAANVNASSTGAAKGIFMLNSKNILTTPIESYTYLQTSTGTNQRVVSAMASTFVASPGNANHVVASQVFSFENAKPLALSSYLSATINGTNDGVTLDTRLKLVATIGNYDDAGNPLTVTKANDLPLSYAYGYGKTVPIAEVRNANYDEFKFEGFEESTGSNITTDAQLSHSGRKFYTGDYTVSFTMPNSRTYVIEYWYQDPTNGWTYISKPYTGTSMILTEGNGIDDVRIYPSDAYMKSYTYLPLLGMTGTISENTETRKYFYDSFGRLSHTLDEKGSIEKQVKYNYRGN